MPNVGVKLFLTIKKNGKIHYNGEAKSWVRNFRHHLHNLLTGYGYYQLYPFLPPNPITAPKHYLVSTGGVQFNWVNPKDTGTPGKDFWYRSRNFLHAIGIGTDGTEVSPDDYELKAKVKEADVYYKVGEGEEDGKPFWELEGIFNINTAMTLREVGLYCYNSHHTALGEWESFKILLSRDLVLPPLPLTEEDTLSVRYKLKVG